VRSGPEQGLELTRRSQLQLSLFSRTNFFLPSLSSSIDRHSATPPLINIHDIHVASPCPMPWEAMAGNAQVRHCDECKLNVYNLSAMTEAEIQRLLAGRTDQRVCVRFYRRADGTLLTQDCPRRLRLLAKRVSRLGAAVLSAFAGVNYGMAKTKTQPQACQRVQPSQSLANVLIVITDPDGAVIPGARIALMGDTGKIWVSGKTDGAGTLMKSDLPSGDYTLKVGVRGFKEHSEHLHLEHSKNVQVNLKLSLAAASATVEVVASPMEVTQGALSSMTEAAPTTPPMPIGRSQPAPMRQ
jgi:Carboxypeptidase regulatory-like domain